MNATAVQPLTFPFQNQNPGKTNVHPIYSTLDAVSFQTRISTEIEDITAKLWNSVSVESARLAQANAM